MYLVALPKAKPASADRLLKFFDQSITFPTIPIGREKFGLLLTLDRRPELIAFARQRIRSTPPRWGLALGYLLAEQGRWDEAIDIFERLAADNDLPSAARFTLAAWHHAKHQLSDEARVLAATVAMENGDGTRHHYQRLTIGASGQEILPPKISPELFEVLRARLKLPGGGDDVSDLIELHEVYAATSDARLPGLLLDILLSRDESDTYGMLYYIDYFLLQEIREGNIRPSQGFASGPTSASKESFTNALLAIVPASERVKSDDDRRTLDLLELILTAKASMVPASPPSYLDRATAAAHRLEESKRTAHDQGGLIAFFASWEGENDRVPKLLQIDWLKERHAAARPDLSNAA